MEEFDVIIVGGGPGGLNCAYHLCNSKLRVLLVEKNDVIGKKVCAGGLTKKAVDYLSIEKSLNKFNSIFVNSKRVSINVKDKEAYKEASKIKLRN